MDEDTVGDANKKLDAMFDAIRDMGTAFKDSAERGDKRMDAMEDRFKEMDSKRKDSEESKEVKEPGAPKEAAADKGRKDAEEAYKSEEISGTLRKDAEEKEEERKDKARKDEEEEEEEEKEKADKARKDAEECKEGEVKDARKDKVRKDEDEDAMADAARRVVGSELASLRAELASLKGRMPAQLSDTDRERYAAIQENAEPAFQAFGDKAGAALDGETPLDYKRRLAKKMQGHSTKWATTRLSGIVDEAALDIVVEQIYADSIVAAERGAEVPAGRLREHTERKPTGHIHNTFTGAPDAWMRRHVGNIKRSGRAN